MLTASIDGSSTTASQLGNALSYPYRRAPSSANAMFGSAIAANLIGGNPTPDTEPAIRYAAA